MLTISNNSGILGVNNLPNFSNFERRVLSYFIKGAIFTFEGKEFSVIKSGKPTCPNGEPKTDIYVLAKSEDSEIKEIKISYKMKNADFIENKMNEERAAQLFGSNWKTVIIKATKSIKDQFENRYLIYKEKFSHTKKGSMTLGWKFELVNKKAGDLSGKIELTPEQVYSVFSGNNLPYSKRNSSVNGEVIAESGIAEYILISDDVSSADDVIAEMQPIDKYIRKHPHIYFACKALNYRTFQDKYDGNRPLAVQVDWKVKSGKLSPDLVFDKPLIKKGDEMANNLKNALNRLNIKTTTQINNDNSDLSKCKIFE